MDSVTPAENVGRIRSPGTGRSSRVYSHVRGEAFWKVGKPLQFIQAREGAGSRAEREQGCHILRQKPRQAVQLGCGRPIEIEGVLQQLASGINPVVAIQERLHVEVLRQADRVDEPGRLGRQSRERVGRGQAQELEIRKSRS
jgi:hypothetical protein